MGLLEQVSPLSPGGLELKQGFSWTLQELQGFVESFL